MPETAVEIRRTPGHCEPWYSAFDWRTAEIDHKRYAQRVATVMARPEAGGVNEGLRRNKGRPRNRS